MENRYTKTIKMYYVINWKVYTAGKLRENIPFTSQAWVNCITKDPIYIFNFCTWQFSSHVFLNQVSDGKVDEEVQRKVENGKERGKETVRKKKCKKIKNWKEKVRNE